MSVDLKKENITVRELTKQLVEKAVKDIENMSVLDRENVDYNPPKKTNYLERFIQYLVVFALSYIIVGLAILVYHNIKLFS